MTVSDKKLKQVALYVETAEQVKKMAQKKGVSIGLYLYNLMDFVLTNNIDYSKELVTASVKQEMERPIKILRAFEKDYFRVLLNDVKLLTEKMEGLDIEVENHERPIIEQSQIDEEKFKEVEYANRELLGRLEWVCGKKEVAKNGMVTITLTSQENQMLMSLLEKYRNVH